MKYRFLKSVCALGTTATLLSPSVAFAANRSRLSATDYMPGFSRRYTPDIQVSPRRGSILRARVRTMRMMDLDMRRTTDFRARTRRTRALDYGQRRRLREGKELTDILRTTKYRTGDLNRRTLRFLRQVLGQ